MGIGRRNSCSGTRTRFKRNGAPDRCRHTRCNQLCCFSYVSDDVDTLNVNGVEPTDENVTTNKWTIWAYEHMYTRDHPKTDKEFLDYILSDEVQDNIVGELGYIPVSHMKVERDWQGNIVKE